MTLFNIPVKICLLPTVGQELRLESLLLLGNHGQGASLVSPPVPYQPWKDWHRPL